MPEPALNFSDRVTGAVELHGDQVRMPLNPKRVTPAAVHLLFIKWSNP